MSYYPKADSYCRNKIKFELDLLDFATKLKMKKVTGVDRSGFVNKINADKLKIVPNHSS